MKYFGKALTFAGRFAAPVILAGALATPASVLAQQKVPPSAALQSCSVNNGECQLDSYAGWFVGAQESARIEQFGATVVKPSVAVEERLAADGRTKVVVFKGANGKYLAVQPDRNWEANFVATSADDLTTQFVAVPALESPRGQTFTSFTSILNPGRFLRHEGFKLYAHMKADTSLFRRDASWRVLNAVTINAPSALKPKTSLPPAPKDGIFYPTSHGDVHIRSMDGLRYDYQAAGDHILFQSLDGDVVIQSRQEMWDENPKVSVNRAGAMRVMGDEVIWYALPTPALFVNGERVELGEEMMKLPKGGTLELTGTANKRTLMVRWPENRPVGRMQMYANGTMDVEIRTDSLQGRKYEGLIGDGNGDRSNDLQIRGGDYLPPDTTSDAIARVGASWRIDQEESMFDGKPKTPATDTARTQPGLQALPAAAREDAAATCAGAGITDPLSLRHCVYDVAATGDKIFVESAKNYQAFVTALPPAERKAEGVEPKDVAAIPASGGGGGGILRPEEVLQRGSRYAMNGYYLLFQADGNLCVYRTQGDQFVWCINNDPAVKYGESAKAQVTRDGRLVVSDAGGKVVWQAPAENAQPGSAVFITDDGALELRTPAGVTMWSSRR